MSKIKDYLEKGGILGRIAAFLFLFGWAVNLIGGTCSHLWAGHRLVEAGIADSGHGLFAILNIVVSAAAFPVVRWAWQLVVDTNPEK